jgi:acetyl-CoA carboxylase beta subunit
MSVRLIERIDHCPDCKFSKLKLHVCPRCQIVIFSTVLERTARCCECREWLTISREVRVKELSGFAEWYHVQRRDEFDFICNEFTKYRTGVLAAVDKRRQLTLQGFEGR